MLCINPVTAKRQLASARLAANGVKPCKAVCPGLCSGLTWAHDVRQSQQGMHTRLGRRRKSHVRSSPGRCSGCCSKWRWPGGSLQRWSCHRGRWYQLAGKGRKGYLGQAGCHSRGSWSRRCSTGQWACAQQRSRGLHRILWHVASPRKTDNVASI